MKAAKIILATLLFGSLGIARAAFAFPGAGDLIHEFGKSPHSQKLYTASDFRSSYIKPLLARNTPISFAECWQTPAEIWPGMAKPAGRIKTMIIFPRGAAKGLVVEMKQEEDGHQFSIVQDFADIASAATARVSSAFSANAWNVGEMTDNADYLLGKRRTLASSQEIDSILSSQPKETCPVYDGSVNGGSARADYTGMGQMTAQGFVDLIMAPLRDQNTPIYFAECALPSPWAAAGERQKEMIIFPKGATKGKFLEFGRSQGAKPASAGASLPENIALGPRVQVEYDGNVSAWVRVTDQLMAEFLVRNGTALIYPKNFASIIYSQPKTICPVQHADPGDAKALDRIYRDNGWDQPARPF